MNTFYLLSVQQRQHMKKSFNFVFSCFLFVYFSLTKYNLFPFFFIFVVRKAKQKKKQNEFHKCPLSIAAQNAMCVQQWTSTFIDNNYHILFFSFFEKQIVCAFFFLWIVFSTGILKLYWCTIYWFVHATAPHMHYIFYIFAHVNELIIIQI